MSSLPSSPEAVSVTSDGPIAPSRFHAAPLVELIRSIAHDLRTPIGVVAQSLAELRAPPLDASADAASRDAAREERRLFLSLADCSVGRLSRMADTLTLLAALEAPGFTLHLEAVDLAALVRDASARAVTLEPRREIRVECDVGASAVGASADRARLGHALTELTINAIRHARGQVRVTLTRKGAEGIVTIEDDGSGVAEDRRATLFHRLTGRPSGSGLGVGVSLARDVIRAHHGNLTVAPSALPAGRPGTVGAGFVCAIPLELGAGDAIPAVSLPVPAEALTQPASVRLLLVDDHADLVEMLCVMLGSRGFVVTPATSVAMALDLVASQPFDVLVTDIGLSDGTGWELLRRLRETQSIPAIAMSGSDSDADLTISRAAGFEAHFTKPVRVEGLVRTIRRVVAAAAPALDGPVDSEA